MRKMLSFLSLMFATFIGQANIISYCPQTIKCPSNLFRECYPLPKGLFISGNEKYHKAGYYKADHIYLIDNKIECNYNGFYIKSDLTWNPNPNSGWVSMKNRENGYYCPTLGNGSPCSMSEIK